ncbi:leucine-rich repeat protein [Tanacetum coccineum]
MKSPKAISCLSSSSRISFLFYGLSIICLTFATVSASYGGNETDYHALLSFKSMITLDPYQVLTSWNHSFHFCEWTGVSCGKRHKRVTALQLDSQGLDGSLSPHVGNLSFLREIFLRNNSFQGTIPHELGRLSRLRRLYLHRNKFSGVIPTNLSGCSNLEELWLGINKLVGSIPKEMSLLSKLARLVIDGNKLTGGIPPFLGNITSMELFSARSNPFGGSIPDTLGLWKSLTTFYSGECELYGSIPHSIFNLSLLVNFSLSGNHLTGGLPSEIGEMLPNLEILQLRDNKLSGVLPPSISNCSKLRSLEMSYNNFSGKLTVDFSKLKDVYKIRLQNNNFHGRGKADDMGFLNSLKNCTRLEVLILVNCNLIGMLPKSIGNLSHQLKFLSLAGNQLFGNLPLSIGSLVGLTTLHFGTNRFKGKIPATIGKLQNLQTLSLSRNQFSGPIPDAIGNLSVLNELILYSNRLERRIPSSLRNCTKLYRLSLGDNRLIGKIPNQILQLPSLTFLLDLSYNNLSGSIPSEIKDLRMLNILDLSYNNLSGNITSSLGGCISLTTLNLRGNIFQGIIPSSLSSLRGLEVLDISQNNLSGNIPQFFDKWFSIQFLNLSFNDFEGEVPVVGVFANASAFLVLGNNKLCGGLVTLKLPICKETGSKKKRFPFFILLILIAPTFLIVLCCLHLFYKKRRNNQPSQSLGNEKFLKVSYNELLKATDGFSTENLIGEGGFSSVYKGILNSDDDKYVVIKVLHLQYRGAHKSFQAECEVWRNIRHHNLLKIITSCSSTDFQGNDFKALVYEFMSNGSVHNWLHSSANTSKLNLLQRINILRDVATALDYLHNRCHTMIVHGDLKPSNILLDDDMVAHVGDFGLARLLGTDLNQHSSTGVKGTIGYAPPEYGIGSEMTSCGDVYSFGILLLEVMTGKKPTYGMFNEGLSLHKFAYMALPNYVIDVIDNDAIELQSTEANAKKVEECLAATIKIGVSCSVDSPLQRMKIEIVVNELQRILNATNWYVTANMTSRLALGDACNLVFSAQSNSSIHLSDANWQSNIFQSVSGRSFWDVPVNQGALWAWKKILSQKRNLKIHIFHRIGDGSDTSVWFDIWSSMCPLSDFIPNRAIYNAGLNLNAKSLIPFLMVNGDGQVPLIQYSQQLASTLSSHETCFTQAADSMFCMHEGLQQAHARIYDVLSAIEILLTGTYERLPKCTEDVGEFKVLLPLVIGDTLQCGKYCILRMAAFDTPFTTLYTILHEFCVPLIMDIVIRQIQALRIGRWKGDIRFELISYGYQGQGSYVGYVQTSQDGEADFVGLRTLGDKILYWLESEKNSQTSDAVSCPFIKIEPGSDLRIKYLHSSSVVDPLTKREAELSINLY